MSEHFIKNIEIKNFKCFDNFKAEGFGRVNLIGGKNNVGKTAFMEACYIHTQNPSVALEEIIYARYQLNILEDFLKGVGMEFIIMFVEDKIDALGKIEIGNNIIVFDRKNIEKDETVSYITQIGISNYRFNKFYSKILENSLEEKIDNFISSFENSIDKFRIINNEPKCRKVNNKEFVNLNEFGDGLSKYISYILSIISSNQGIIFIDEIENGIHYTNLDKLWEIILTLSKDQNVQVFATTHSKECIESYARVAKRLKEEDTKFIELFRDNDEIKTIVLDNEMLTYQLEQNHEVR